MPSRKGEATLHGWANIMYAHTELLRTKRKFPDASHVNKGSGKDYDIGQLALRDEGVLYKKVRANMGWAKVSMPVHVYDGCRLLCVTTKEKDGTVRYFANPNNLLMKAALACMAYLASIKG